MLTEMVPSALLARFESFHRKPSLLMLGSPEESPEGRPTGRLGIPPSSALASRARRIVTVEEEAGGRNDTERRNRGREPRLAANANGALADSRWEYADAKRSCFLCRGNRCNVGKPRSAAAAPAARVYDEYLG